MTDWNVPMTFTGNSVPTAANLDTHWRDNLTHLKETEHGFQQPSSMPDIRLIGSAGGMAFAYPFYVRSHGRGNFRVLGYFVWVTTSSGNVSIGSYRNLVTDDFPEGVPGARIATTASQTCPATGSALVLTVGPTEAMDAGDWFGWAGTTGSAIGRAWQGSTGWELFKVERPIVILTDVNKALVDLPDNADPDFESASGSAGGMVIVGG